MSANPPFPLPLPSAQDRHPWLATLRPERLFVWEETARKNKPEHPPRSIWAIDPDHFEEMTHGERSGRVLSLAQWLTLRDTAPVILGDGLWEHHPSRDNTPERKRARDDATPTRLQRLGLQSQWWGVAAHSPIPQADGAIQWEIRCRWFFARSRQSALRAWGKEQKREKNASACALASAWRLDELFFMGWQFQLLWHGWGGAADASAWRGRLPSPGFLRRLQPHGNALGSAQGNQPMPDFGRLHPHEVFANTEAELTAISRPKSLSSSTLAATAIPAGFVEDAPAVSLGATWLDIPSPRPGEAHPWEPLLNPSRLILFFPPHLREWRATTAFGPYGFLSQRNNMRPNQPFLSFEHLLLWGAQKKRNPALSKPSIFGRAWAVAWWEQVLVGDRQEWHPRAAWIRAPFASWAEWRGVVKAKSGALSVRFHAFKEKDLLPAENFARAIWSGARSHDSQFLWGDIPFVGPAAASSFYGNLSAAASWEEFVPLRDARQEPDTFALLGYIGGGPGGMIRLPRAAQ